MRRCCEIDLLTRQHIELGDALAETLELRQMRVQIERAYTLKKLQPIKRRLDLYRRGRPVRLSRGMEPEAVLDRYAEAGKERACQSTELLLRRNRLIAVVQEVRQLAFQKLVMTEARHVADIVMRAYENQVVGLCEEFAHSLDFGTPGLLAGAE
jgi:hypothetical protein